MFNCIIWLIQAFRIEVKEETWVPIWIEGKLILITVILLLNAQYTTASLLLMYMNFSMYASNKKSILILMI